jgi:hypothetical protein
MCQRDLDSFVLGKPRERVGRLRRSRRGQDERESRERGERD